MHINTLNWTQGARDHKMTQQLLPNDCDITIFIYPFFVCMKVFDLKDNLNDICLKLIPADADEISSQISEGDINTE